MVALGATVMHIEAIRIHACRVRVGVDHRVRSRLDVFAYMYDMLCYENNIHNGGKSDLSKKLETIYCTGSRMIIIR